MLLFSIDTASSKSLSLPDGYSLAKGPVHLFFMCLEIWQHALCMYVVFSANRESEENMEELDEDIAVSQSQVNFTCPLTQVHY